MTKSCNKALFIFHEDLITLLKRPHESGRVVYQFKEHPALKDCIEACGIPHTEVGAIGVQGRSAAIGYQLQDGDRIDVYPASNPPDHLQDLTGSVPRPVRFVLDVHLGKLAVKLRLLGFDCLYSNQYDDPEIVAIASSEQRVVLTRDRGILKRNAVENGLLVRSSLVFEQLLQVLKRFELFTEIRTLSRCSRCNGLLDDVDKAEVSHLLLPGTRKNYHYFKRCRECGKIYWQGAHAKDFRKWLFQLEKSAER